MTVPFFPNFNLERHSNADRVVGVDEAGCGPWAGPVVVAAVSFQKKQWDDIEKSLSLNDSKKLTAKKRELLFERICDIAAFGIGVANVEEIDTLNIVGAVRLATKHALFELEQNFNFFPECALVDGIRNPKLNIPTHMIIKGDQKSCSIAAASILAKVTRDRYMAALNEKFPAYAWDRNAGYGTKAHQEALKTHGITIHHRKSYAPIRKIIENGPSYFIPPPSAI